MSRVRRRLPIALVLAALVLLPLPVAAQAGAGGGSGNLVAYLDGKPLQLSEVGNHYCDDFSYPVITCFSDSARLQSRVSSILSAAAIDYVVIYDYTGYAGAYMYVSEDYTVLALIGWNDRISSFRGVNSETGHFYQDWFYGGTGWYFCCNWQYASLGSADNSFSSVHRN